MSIRTHLCFGILLVYGPVFRKTWCGKKRQASTSHIARSVKQCEHIIEVKRTLKEKKTKLSIQTVRQNRKDHNNYSWIMWVRPRDTVEVLECWNKYSTHSEHKERWKIVPACIWWIVWKERNQRCFEDNYNSTQKVKMKCLALFYFWRKHEYMEYVESFVDVIGSL